MRTSILLDRDGSRTLHHYGADQAWEHADTPKERAACEACILQEKERTSKAEVRPHALDGEADELVAQAASGQEFNELAKRGWKPRSLRSGNGLDTCPPDCGVCFPTAAIRERSRRETKKGKK